MDKEKLKVLLRESLEIFEAEKKDEKDDGKHYVTQGEQDELKGLAKHIYDFNLGQKLSDCVFGKDSSRTQQSKLRKFMLGDPYGTKDHPDVGKTPRHVGEKAIMCITKIRSKLGKV